MSGIPRRRLKLARLQPAPQPMEVNFSLPARKSPGGQELPGYEPVVSVTAGMTCNCCPAPIVSGAPENCSAKMRNVEPLSVT
jgi:hypothetical protein